MQVKNTYSLETAIEMSINMFNNVTNILKNKGYVVEIEEPENRPAEHWYQSRGIIKKVNNHSMWMEFEINYKSTERWGRTDLTKSVFYPQAKINIFGRKTTFTVLDANKLVGKIESVLKEKEYEKKMSDASAAKKNAAAIYYNESKNAVDVTEDNSQYLGEYKTKHGTVKILTDKTVRFVSAITIHELAAIHELLSKMRNS